MSAERDEAAIEFGRALADHRARLGLSQEQAADRVGVTLRAYQRWEGGETTPYARNRRKLERALNFSRPTGTMDGAIELKAQLDRIETKLDALADRLPSDVELAREAAQIALAVAESRAEAKSPGSRGALGRARS